MDEIKNCPKCGMELQVCDNCENVGCPNCDGYTITRDDVLLCSECSADILAEWNKQTENGAKVCGTCSPSRTRMSTATVGVTKTTRFITARITAEIICQGWRN